MRTKSLFLWGLFIWGVPFVVAMILFPIRGSERALFESLMAVTLVKVSVVAANKYLRLVKKNVVLEALKAGWLWMAMSIGIDCLLFSWGPMKMSIVEYTKDIGVSYLIIPIIVFWMGKMRENK